MTAPYRQLITDGFCTIDPLLDSDQESNVEFLGYCGRFFHHLDCQ